MAADRKIREARQTLEKHLNGLKIASTTGSVVTTAGAATLWFPLVGVPLMAAGTVMSITTSVLEGAVFEKNAFDSFSEASNKVQQHLQ